MPDNNPEQPKPQQEGGTPMRPPVEADSRPFSPQDGVSAMTRRGILGAFAGFGSLALFGKDRAQAAITPVEVAPVVENQTVSTLNQLLQKSLLSKEEVLKNPAIPVASANQIDPVTGKITARYSLQEDKRSNTSRVTVSRRQPDETFSENSFVGNIAMKDPKSIAVDIKGNVVVGGQETDALSSPGAIEVLFAGASGFVGIDVDSRDITDIAAAGDVFLLSTLDGLKLLTINPQAANLSDRAKFATASVTIKDTNLPVGRVIGLAVPSDIQTQSTEISFYTTLAKNAQNGVTKITLDKKTATGIAEQKFQQIGGVDQPSLYTDSITGHKHMVVVNNSSADYFDLNLTTEVIDKVYNFFDLIVSQKNLPPGSVGSTGALYGPTRVGDMNIGAFTYIRVADGSQLIGIAAWQKDVDLKKNPEKAILLFPFNTDKINAGIVSFKEVPYQNGLKSIELVTKGVRVSAPSLGVSEIPLDPDGIPNVSGMVFPQKGRQSFNAFVTSKNNRQE